jgi:excisionase family DNA binding protein
MTALVPALLTVAQTASILGVSVPAVYRMVERRDLPLAMLSGGYRRIAAATVERLIGRRLTTEDFAEFTSVAPSLDKRTPESAPGGSTA